MHHDHHDDENRPMDSERIVAMKEMTFADNRLRLPAQLETAKLLKLKLDWHVLQVLMQLVAESRRDQAHLSAESRHTFNQVIEAALKDGAYQQMAAIHGDMTHNMHSMSGLRGTLRFLAWHRAYLYKFEQLLGHYRSGFRLPYWDWTQDAALPAWVTVPVGVSRAPGADGSLPTKAQVDALMARETYLSFTSGLEGLHNDVHMWIGGSMTQFTTAPDDPLFWLHHAQVDRLWAQWQRKHPAELPPLGGADATLDPWPLTVSDVLDVSKLDYTYL